MIEGFILAMIAAAGILAVVYVVRFARLRSSRGRLHEALEKFKSKEWSLHEAAAYANMDPTEVAATITFLTGQIVSVADGSKRDRSDG